MNDNPDFRQLQEGLVDFDTVFTRVAARAGYRIDGPTYPDTLIRRNAAGRVLLMTTDADAEPRALPLERRKIALLQPETVDFEGRVKAALPSPPPREVISLSLPRPGVALVTMQDEINHNMVTAELSQGLARAFRSISTRSDVQVVVIGGTKTWFCSGGTPDTLEAIRRRERSFLDDPIFRVLLDCPFPTIAAMEGHALGGGLTFALYADIIVIAEQAKYAANFMDHGFTPGVGATLLFPYKLGPVLGAEMLLTGRQYLGREFGDRGAPFIVLPRDQVLPHALDLAARLAGMPKQQLIELKACLTEPIRKALPDAFGKEQAMHDTVFADVRQSRTV